MVKAGYGALAMWLSDARVVADRDVGRVALADRHALRGRGTHQTVHRVSDKPISADRCLSLRAVPVASVVSVISLGPSKRSRAPFTGRGAHVGSAIPSTGHVGPAVTVTTSDPECSASADWPRPSATSSSNQITNRHLTLAL
jgi:hypothetical protein